MPDLPPPTPEEIARWRELDERATKGPWESGINPAHDPYRKVGSTSNYYVVRPAGEFPHGDWVADCGRKYGVYYYSNAALIAEYRTAVPRLLDRVEALEAERAVHRFGRKAR